MNYDISRAFRVKRVVGGVIMAGIDPLLGPEEDVFTPPRSDETGEPPDSVADSHAVLDDGFEEMLAQELFPASGSQGDTDEGGQMMGAYEGQTANSGESRVALDGIAGAMARPVEDQVGSAGAGDGGVSQDAVEPLHGGEVALQRFGREEVGKSRSYRFVARRCER